MFGYLRDFGRVTFMFSYVVLNSWKLALSKYLLVSCINLHMQSLRIVYSIHPDRFSVFYCLNYSLNITVYFEARGRNIRADLLIQTFPSI